MRRGTILVVSSLLSLPLSNQAGPGEFRDYARVVDVEPIVAAETYRPDSIDCSEPDRALGADPSQGFAASIGADVRRQNRHKTDLGTAACGQAQAGRIIGYRVTYHYRGKTLVRRLQQPPRGDLAVRVRVRALP
jgi:hypothetical protein